MKTFDPFAASPDVRRLMIFGHPAHELALFGAIQRLKPEIVVVTDGGGPEREEYSRRGLREIGLPGRARYLGYRESDFYRALLDSDTGYFDGVVARLGEEIDRVQPHQVFCDAVEFYNPVHDITLVLVRAALAGRPAVEIFLVPLIYQVEAEGESYEIQRVPRALADRCVALELTDAELAHKRHALNEIYLNLHDQAAGDFLGLPDSCLRREEVEAFAALELAPGRDGRRLRYEWRADVLRNEGLIQRRITFHDHFAPMVEHYLGSRAA